MYVPCYLKGFTSAQKGCVRGVYGVPLGSHFWRLQSSFMVSVFIHCAGSVQYNRVTNNITSNDL